MSGGTCQTHGVMWFSDSACPDCKAGSPAHAPNSSSLYGFATYGETVPAEVSAPVDGNGSLVLEPDCYVGPCPGTFGMGPCTETLGAGDVIGGRTVCWRCGYRA